MKTYEHLSKVLKTEEQLTPYLQRIFPFKIAKLILCAEFPTDFDVQIKETGLYLYGPSGVGKTFSACFTLLAQIKRFSDFKKICFKNVTQMLFEFKQSYSREIEYTETQLLEKYSTVPYLVLDDIGVDPTTDWTFKMLYLIINNRDENLLPTIYTSNLDLQELETKLGDARIPSRIQGNCDIIRLEGRDLRIKN